MSEKLTPRVGDRVLIRQEGDTHTYIGTVNDRGNNGQGDIAGVEVDGQGRRALWLHELEVIDREPVEWPEGWSRHDRDAVVHDSSAWALDRNALRLLLATGPDMLARWDELMGES